MDFGNIILLAFIACPLVVHSGDSYIKCYEKVCFTGENCVQEELDGGFGVSQCSALEAFGCYFKFELDQNGDKTVFTGCAKDSDPCVHSLHVNNTGRTENTCCATAECNPVSNKKEIASGQDLCYQLECSVTNSANMDCLVDGIKNGIATSCPKTQYGCFVQTKTTGLDVTVQAGCLASNCIDSDSSSSETTCCTTDLCNNFSIPDEQTTTNVPDTTTVMDDSTTDSGSAPTTHGGSATVYTCVLLGGMVMTAIGMF